MDRLPGIARSGPCWVSLIDTAFRQTSETQCQRQVMDASVAPFCGSCVLLLVVQILQMLAADVPFAPLGHEVYIAEPGRDGKCICFEKPVFRHFGPRKARAPQARIHQGLDLH